MNIHQLHFVCAVLFITALGILVASIRDIYQRLYVPSPPGPIKTLRIKRGNPAWNEPYFEYLTYQLNPKDGPIIHPTIAVLRDMFGIILAIGMILLVLAAWR